MYSTNCKTKVFLHAGVTFCGNSSSSEGLTLRNVPWHEEVLYFVSLLVNLLEDYEIACEHEHSNCVLIAHKKVKAKTFPILCPDTFYMKTWA